jgi:Fur family ferric uptake transcriptional regulator/Fur family peroxide stress response transcriptional regulator
MTEKEIYTYLQNHEVKPSMQRVAVMKYLLNHRTHPNVDEIYNHLHKKMPTLSKTTVYNTLRLFAEQGVALMLMIDERNLCFDGDVTPHAHFICTKCNKIYDLFFDPFIHEHLARKVDGHQIDEVHQYYKGVCKHCLKEKTEI